MLIFVSTDRLTKQSLYPLLHMRAPGYLSIISPFRAYSGYICHETFSFIMSLLAMSFGDRFCFSRFPTWNNHSCVVCIWAIQFLVACNLLYKCNFENHYSICTGIIPLVLLQVHRTVQSGSVVLVNYITKQQKLGVEAWERGHAILGLCL